jgi:hypothetical protein
VKRPHRDHLTDLGRIQTGIHIVQQHTRRAGTVWHTPHGISAATPANFRNARRLSIVVRPRSRSESDSTLSVADSLSTHRLFCVLRSFPGNAPSPCDPPPDGSLLAFKHSPHRVYRFVLKPYPF